MPELVRYIPAPGLPAALICDIDGTIALRGLRDPHDETCVENDTANRPVLDALLRLAEGSTKIIFLSGRSRACEDTTWRWLKRHIPSYFKWELHMRFVGDDRPDQFMKADLFDLYVRGRFDVKWVLDELAQLGRTLHRRRDDILAWFSHPGTSNGPTEAICECGGGWSGTGWSGWCWSCRSGCDSRGN